MTIDTSGEWWRGSDAEDLEEYLRGLASEEGGYGVEVFRVARCSCGANTFLLRADCDEGAAERTCAACGTRHLIGDSGYAWKEARPRKWRCVCKSDKCNIGVGFSLLEGGADVRWLYLGVRCASCWVLGCHADWKIGYSPSIHLLELV